MKPLVAVVLLIAACSGSVAPTGQDAQVVGSAPVQATPAARAQVYAGQPIDPADASPDAPPPADAGPCRCDDPACCHDPLVCWTFDDAGSVCAP